MFARVLFICLTWGFLGAQTTPYFPLEQGDNWLFSEFGYFTDYRTIVLGDKTLPNGKTYAEVWSQFDYNTAFYRQSNDSVFFSRFGSGEYLFYAFNADSGDVITELPLPYSDTLRIVLEWKGMAEIFGRQLRIWGFSYDRTALLDDDHVRTVVDSLGLYSLVSPHWFAYRLKGAEVNGLQYGTLTSVEPSMQLAEDFTLAQNYPNPFNPTTTIQYSLPEAADVTLTIYDLAGRKVAELVTGRQAAGVYEQQFEASGLASGVYVYRLQSGEYVQARKMLLVK